MRQARCLVLSPALLRPLLMRRAMALANAAGADNYCYICHLSTPFDVMPAAVSER